MQTQTEPEHFAALSESGLIPELFDESVSGELSELEASDLQLVSHTVSVAAASHLVASPSSCSSPDTEPVDCAHSEFAVDAFETSENLSIEELCRDTAAIIGRSPGSVLLIGGTAVIAYQVLSYRRASSKSLSDSTGSTTD